MESKQGFIRDMCQGWASTTIAELMGVGVDARTIIVVLPGFMQDFFVRGGNYSTR